MCDPVSVGVGVLGGMFLNDQASKAKSAAEDAQKQAAQQQAAQQAAAQQAAKEQAAAAAAAQAASQAAIEKAASDAKSKAEADAKTKADADAAQVLTDSANAANDKVASTKRTYRANVLASGGSSDALGTSQASAAGKTSVLGGAGQ